MKFNFNISLWAIFSAYAITNGLIYSWAFWSTFKVNILQYVTVYDLMASIIYLIAGPFAIFVIYSIFVRVGFLATPVPKITPKLSTNTTPPKLALRLKYYLNNVFNLLSFAFYYFMTVTTYNDSIGYKKLIVLFLIFLPIMMMLLNITSAVYKDKIPFNSVVLSVIIAAPFFLFLNAKSKADDIINGRDTFLVQSDSECLSNNKFRYISTIGDKAFAISLNDNSLCVFKYNYLKLIEETSVTSTYALPVDRI